MKNIFLFFVGFLTMQFLLVPEVKAQATVAATATAEVIEALSSSETSQLNFGRFSPETQGGKIVLTPDGERSTQGTVVLGGGTHSPASFRISGQYESTFSITLPGGPATLTNEQSNKTMQVAEWQSDPPAGIGVGKLIGGEMNVKVGASLIIGDMNANPVGVYAGTYSVTFAYN